MELFDMQMDRTVRLTTGRMFGWDIREYRRTDGLGGGFTYLYDAAEVNGVGLSPGFDTYAEAEAFIIEQRQIALAHRNDEPSALRKAFG